MAKNLTLSESAVIAVSGTESPVIPVPTGLTLIGMHIPNNLTATSIKFKAAKDANATAQLVKTVGNTDYEVTATTLTASYRPLDPNVFQGVSHVSLIVGTTQATTAATIVLVFGVV